MTALRWLLTGRPDGRRLERWLETSKFFVARQESIWASVIAPRWITSQRFQQGSGRPGPRRFLHLTLYAPEIYIDGELLLTQA